MKTKATISIDPETLQQAKRLARHENTSVSALIEELLKRAASRSESLVDGMIGSAELKEIPEGDLLGRRLRGKYVHP